MSSEPVKPAAAAAPVVKLTEGQWTALSVLGHLYLRLGALDKAERLFKALSSLRPGHVQAAASLAAALQARGEHGAALARLEKLMDSRPLATADSYLWLMRASSLWALDRPKEAERALNEYLASSPGTGEEAAEIRSGQGRTGRDEAAPARSREGKTRP